MRSTSSEEYFNKAISEKREGEGDMSAISDAIPAPSYSPAFFYRLKQQDPHVADTWHASRD